MVQQPLVGQSHFIVEVSRQHSDTQQSVGLLWTSDRPDAEILITQILARHRHSCPRRDSNPASKRPQHQAVDRAATGVGQKMLLQIEMYLYPTNSTMGILQTGTGTGTGTFHPRTGHEGPEGE